MTTRCLLSRVASRTFATNPFANKILIETHELETLMKEEPERLSLFNASYPTATAKPRENHISKRISQSVFFDFDEFSDKGSKLSYMVPSEAQFEDTMRKVNVRKNDIVVVYDKVGMLSSPRAFWLLKLFGMPNVMLLNGTFSKWDSENRSSMQGDSSCAWSRVSRKSQPSADDLKFSIDNKKIRLYDDMVKIS